jgi:hypothetical protein
MCYNGTDAQPEIRVTLRVRARPRPHESRPTAAADLLVLDVSYVITKNTRAAIAGDNYRNRDTSATPRTQLDRLPAVAHNKCHV